MSGSASFLDRLKQWGPIDAVSTKIRAKLMVTLMCVSLVPLVSLGVVMYRSASKGLMSQAANQLDAVRKVKANQVEAYFEQISNQISTFAEDRMVIDAMRQFPEAMRQARAENEVSDEKMAELATELRTYYTNEFTEEYKSRNDGNLPPSTEQFAQLTPDAQYLQYLYVRNNPNPLGQKENLDKATDNSRYTKMHGVFHPVVRNYLRKFGYYDVFLAELDTGNVVYTVFKELDFTTSLRTGRYAETNIGRAFRMAAEATSKDDVFFVDYENYLPSYEDPAGFVAAPIFDGEKKIGVAIFQVPIDKVQAIMAERTGLGRTGETYAVGPDKLFRNDSRFLTELGVKSTIINPKVRVETKASEEALAGKEGYEIIPDYRGTPVLSSWGPMTVYSGVEGKSEPIRWGLMSEIDLAEVREPISATGMAQNASVIVGFAALFGLTVSLWFARGITRQAESITNMLGMIGIGDFDARADIVTRDELGDVAIALNAMCDNTLTLIQSREERDSIQTSVDSLMGDMNRIAAGDLSIEAEVDENIIGAIAGSVNYMTGQLREIVHQVHSATSAVTDGALEIRETTEELSRGNEAQADRIVEASERIQAMTNSIRKVTSQTMESVKVAEHARENASQGYRVVSETVEGMQRIRNQVQETSKRIKRLGESSQEIGEIVQLISDIADRTSILALNASIQAAMAGDAGQGFAVVAEEVERLAERCNDATKQIATLIKAIQTETSEAIADMEESTREVVDGSKLAQQAGQTLASIDSTSQQLAELIRGVSQSAESQVRDAQEVAETMTEISATTLQAAHGSRNAAESVSRLASLASDLRQSVAQFKLDQQELQSQEASYVRA
jgi:methyl-accepting chemotaxis protein